MGPMDYAQCNVYSPVSNKENDSLKTFLNWTMRRNHTLWIQEITKILLCFVWVSWKKMAFQEYRSPSFSFLNLIYTFCKLVIALELGKSDQHFWWSHFLRRHVGINHLVLWNLSFVSWLCATPHGSQDLILVCWRGIILTAGIESVSAASRASALAPALFLWPQVLVVFTTLIRGSSFTASYLNDFSIKSFSSWGLQ